MHLHGITLILWCLMLISQAYLIRSKRHALHRTIGKFSYVLVPAMVFTTLDLLQYQLQKQAVLGATEFFFVALVVNALIAFVIYYGLAIFYRKKSMIHARYMVCTIFPMLTPATDRIIYIFFSLPDTFSSGHRWPSHCSGSRVFNCRPDPARPEYLGLALAPALECFPAGVAGADAVSLFGIKLLSIRFLAVFLPMGFSVNALA